MSGELLAFRRASLGAPVSEYSLLVDRARVNKGGKGTTVAYPTATAATSIQGIVATADATPHTKGAWVELVASTAFAAETLIVTLHSTVSATSANTAMLLDIGTGAAASEVALIANLLVGYTQATAARVNSQTFILPLAVPAGTRISARIQATVVSATLSVGIQYRAHGTHSAPGRTVTSIGPDTATSAGAIPTVATATNTKSVWTELTASTTADYRYLLVAVSPTSTNSVTANDGLIDIGVGGAGSEVVIIPDLTYSMNVSEVAGSRGAELAFTVAIPVGSRIAFRYQATATANAARPTVAVYGIT